MEDRYLFKGKRIDNGEWITGYLLVKKKDFYICEKPYECMDEYSSLNGQSYGFGGFKFVDQSTICQCTGLKDKNGKLIWENDIVGYYDKYLEKWFYGLVGYGEFNCSCCSGVYGWHFGDEDIREYQCYEVKGNKFDNPELLESEEKQ